MASDIPQLRSFVLEAWRLAGPSALGWVGATDDEIAETASEGHLLGFIENPNLRVFISRIGENLVGFCALRKIDDHSVELAGIIVRQDQLGKHIGTDVFEIARKEADTSEFTTMLVKTESTNDRALSFYRSKGFVIEKQEIEEVGGTKVDLKVLKLKI